MTIDLTSRVLPWPTARRLALERARYSCESFDCERTATDAHHIIPRSEGGPDETWNLMALCAPCHTDEHRRHPAERSRRTAPVEPSPGELQLLAEIAAGRNDDEWDDAAERWVPFGTALWRAEDAAGALRQAAA